MRTIFLKPSQENISETQFAILLTLMCKNKYYRKILKS